MTEPSQHILTVTQPNVIFVAGHTRPGSAAGAIAHRVRETGQAAIQCIGLEAKGKAVTALIIATSLLSGDGIALSFTVAHVKTQIGDVERTAVRFEAVGVKG